MRKTTEKIEENEERREKDEKSLEKCIRKRKKIR